MELPKTIDEAEALHRQVAAIPTDVPRLWTAAALAVEEQRLDEAHKLILGALIAAPRRSTSWRLAGVLGEARGETDEAELAYRQALELEDDAESALRLANLLGSEGRFEEGLGWANSLAVHAEDLSIRARAEALVDALERRGNRA